MSQRDYEQEVIDETFVDHDDELINYCNMQVVLEDEQPFECNPYE